MGRTATDLEAVLASNRLFYRSFDNRDLASLEALWARRAPVACIHPGWPALHGREEVMLSWRSSQKGLFLGLGEPKGCYHEGLPLLDCHSSW